MTAVRGRIRPQHGQAPSGACEWMSRLVSAIIEPQIAGFGQTGQAGSHRGSTGTQAWRAITTRTIWPATLLLDGLVAKANNTLLIRAAAEIGDRTWLTARKFRLPADGANPAAAPAQADVNRVRSPGPGTAETRAIGVPAIARCHVTVAGPGDSNRGVQSGLLRLARKAAPAPTATASRRDACAPSPTRLGRDMWAATCALNPASARCGA